MALPWFLLHHRLDPTLCQSQLWIAQDGAQAGERQRQEEAGRGIPQAGRIRMEAHGKTKRPPMAVTAGMSPPSQALSLSQCPQSCEQLH